MKTYGYEEAFDIFVFFLRTVHKLKLTQNWVLLELATCVHLYMRLKEKYGGE